jgi:hypothetical protein
VSWTCFLTTIGRDFFCKRRRFFDVMDWRADGTASRSESARLSESRSEYSLLSLWNSASLQGCKLPSMLGTMEIFLPRS